MRPLLFALLLTGCAQAPVATFEDAFSGVDPELRPPPTQSLRLWAGSMVPGSTIRVVISGLLPSERVFLGRGTGLGAGPCLPAGGGICLDILGPTQLVGQLTANASGVVDQTFNLPAMPYGRTIALQAVTFRGVGGVDSAKSNAVRRITTPGADTLEDVAAGDLVISEVMNNPAAVSDTAGEWFEIFNRRGNDLDLTGLVVSDLGGESFTITRPLLLPAGGYVTLGRQGDPAQNGGVALDHTYAGLTLGNADDEIILSYDGAELDAVAWDDGATFPDPDGQSLSLDPTAMQSTTNDNGAYWCAATSLYGAGDRGTPGAANDDCMLAPPGYAADEDFESGAFDRLPYSFIGPQPWVIETNAAACYEGVFCMRSSPTHAPSTTNAVSLALSVRADTTVSFWAKTHSEPGEHFLRFAVDGVEQLTLSGTHDWALYSFPVLATGANGPDRVLTWTYDRSGYFDVTRPPHNEVWVDAIQIPDFNTAPTAPEWTGPNTGLQSAGDPTFSWFSDDPDLDAITYVLEVDDDPAFSSPMSSGETFATDLQQGLTEGAWFARVRARDSVDYRWSAWSPTLSVRVDAATGDDRWALREHGQLALADIDGPRLDGDRVVATSAASTTFASETASQSWAHGTSRYGVPKTDTIAVPTDLPVGTTAAMHLETVGPWDPGSFEVRIDGELVQAYTYPGANRFCVARHDVYFDVPNLERFADDGELVVEFTPYLLGGCTDSWRAYLDATIVYTPGLPGTVTSPIIEHGRTFDGGAFWDKARWSGSGGVILQVLDAAGTPISDTALPGNAAGFTTSTVPLYTLDPALHPAIRLQATLPPHAELSGLSVTGGDDLVWDFEIAGDADDLLLGTADPTATLEISGGVATLASTAGGPDPSLTVPFLTPIPATRFSELSVNLRTSNNYVFDDVTVSWASNFGTYDPRRSFTQTVFLFGFQQVIFDLTETPIAPMEPMQGQLEGIRLSPATGFYDPVGAPAAGWAELEELRIR